MNDSATSARRAAEPGSADAAGAAGASGAIGAAGSVSAIGTGGPVDAPSLAGRLTAALIYYLPSVLVMLALLVFWQLGVQLLGVKEYILPTPLAALRTLGDPNYQWTANFLATLYSVLGAFALWTGVEPGVDAIDVSVSPWLIAIAVAVGVMYIWVMVRALLQMRRVGGVTDKPVVELVGSMGTAQTLIGPTGIAYAGGESWSARSREADIRPGTPLRIIGVEGLELIVEPARAGDGGATEG